MIPPAGPRAETAQRTVFYLPQVPVSHHFSTLITNWPATIRKRGQCRRSTVFLAALSFRRDSMHRTVPTPDISITLKFMSAD
jgi:hypothetical protein